MLVYLILGAAAVLGILLLILVSRGKTTEKPSKESPLSSASSVDALPLENQNPVDQPMEESASPIEEETENPEQN